MKQGGRIVKFGLALEVAFLCGAYLMFKKFHSEPEFRRSFEEKFPWAYSTITLALPSSMQATLEQQDSQQEMGENEQ